MSDLWVVVHESPMPRGATYYGIASGPSPSRSGAENQLAYCEGCAAEGRRGFDGRYFLARVVEEVSDGSE